DDRDGAERHRLPDLTALVPPRRIRRRNPVTSMLSDLRCQYLTGEPIVASGLPAQVVSALGRTAFGRTFAGEVSGGEARFHGIPVGTHTIELYGADETLLAE